MQFLYTLVIKKYNDATSDNIVLCAYINQGFQSAYSNEIIQIENLMLYKVFWPIFRLRLP